MFLYYQNIFILFSSHFKPTAEKVQEIREVTRIERIGKKIVDDILWWTICHNFIIGSGQTKLKSFNFQFNVIWTISKQTLL